VVFTLPDSINVLAMQDPRLVYDLLFESAWATLKSFGKAKEIQTGMIAVCTLGDRTCPCIRTYTASYRAVDKNGNWKNIRGDGSCFQSRRCPRF
jgi:hypothetical protein